MKKQCQNFVIIEAVSIDANKDFLCSSISKFASQMDFTSQELEDIETAVGEAIANVITHAYRNALGRISIHVSNFNNKLLEIRVSDLGCGIEDIDAARRPMNTSKPFECSGMGFTVMESFMDSITVKSTPGKGTTVILNKVCNTKKNG